MMSACDLAAPRRSLLASPCAQGALAILVCVAALGAGCKSPPKVRPFDMVRSNERPSAADELLGVPVRSSATRTESGPRASGPVGPPLPLAPSATSRAIDADVTDWDMSKIRPFRDRRFLESGAEHWSGIADANFRVNVDADAGYMYFLVEVQDDVVLDSDPAHSPQDAVILRLHDPRLTSLREALPDVVLGGRKIYEEAAVVITPSGKFTRMGPGPSLAPGSVQVATVQGSQGYRVEAALSLAVFPHLSALPLEELAFRVEVLDSDAPESDGAQSVLSILPRSGDETPDWALYTPGTPLLAPRQALNPPLHKSTLGVWSQTSEGWEFRSYESVSAQWVPVAEPMSLKDLSQARKLPAACSRPNTEARLMHVHAQGADGPRTALAVCGPRAGSACAAKSSTEVALVRLGRQGATWQVEESLALFSQPLGQCVDGAAPGQPYHEAWALTHLGSLSEHMWAVGWSMTEEASGPRGVTNRSSHVLLMQPGKSTSRLGELRTAMTRTSDQTRTLSVSQVYFVDIDDDRHADICEMEYIQEQNCRERGQGCETPHRGRKVAAHIRTWNRNRQVFEPFLETKHKRCSPPFAFETSKSYLLLQVHGRLGLIPSPASGAKGP